MLRRVAVLVLVLLAGSVLFAGEAAKPTAIDMTAPDGEKITGWLWGKGETGLVLCHGRAYLDGGKSFDRECQYFAARGVQCLAVNFRGYPADAPPDAKGKENDVMAAFGALATRGARRIYVLGSSMGGFAALDALGELTSQPQFAGLIILSAFHKTACDSADCPKLFFYAKDDERLYKYMQMTFYKAAAPKQAVVFKTGGHGQQMLKAYGQDVVDQIWLFMREEEQEGS